MFKDTGILWTPAGCGRMGTDEGAEITPRSMREDKREVRWPPDCPATDGGSDIEFAPWEDTGVGPGGRGGCTTCIKAKAEGKFAGAGKEATDTRLDAKTPCPCNGFVSDVGY